MDREWPISGKVAFAVILTFEFHHKDCQLCILSVIGGCVPTLQVSQIICTGNNLVSRKSELRTFQISISKRK